MINFCYTHNDAIILLCAISKEEPERLCPRSTLYFSTFTVHSEIYSIYRRSWYRERAWYFAKREQPVRVFSIVGSCVESLCRIRNQASHPYARASICNLYAHGAFDRLTWKPLLKGDWHWTPPQFSSEVHPASDTFRWGTRWYPAAPMPTGNLR